MGTVIPLDRRQINNTDEPEYMVVHGPTWLCTYAWDTEAEAIRDQCVKERWQERRTGAVLHVIPPMFAEGMP